MCNSANDIGNQYTLNVKCHFPGTYQIYEKVCMQINLNTPGN
jgi:hypothetical protein